MKLKNGKAAGKDEVTGEMIKGGGDRVVDWILMLFNIVFESGAVPEDWRSAVIVPLHKGKRERTECSNYRGISMLIRVGEIYAEILEYRGRKVTKSLIDDKQEGFRE